MGVDARILVKVKVKGSERITEEQAIELSYRAGVTFGSEEFLIIHPQHAAMYSGPRRAISIIPPYDTGHRYWEEGDPNNDHHLKGKTLYFQDGPNIEAEPDEQFLEVSVQTRYYGEGYERGDLPFIILLSEWLEYVIPGCEVWYGGDSSGIEAELFDRQARDVLKGHYFDHGHEPYISSPYRDYLHPIRPRCEFCGGKVMANSGGGPGSGGKPIDFNTCSGCGYAVISDRATGEVLKMLDMHTDFFKGAEELRKELEAGAETTTTEQG